MGIELLAGTPPGGGQDRAARALADALEGHVDVLNISGRGGGNAWDRLHQHGGDGAVAAISSQTIVTNKLLAVSDIDDRDLTPIAQLCTEFLVFAVRSDADIEDGSLRILAVSSSNRLGEPLAGSPTWQELGIDVVIGIWRGLVGPAGLSTAWRVRRGVACASAVVNSREKNSAEQPYW